MAGWKFYMVSMLVLMEVHSFMEGRFGVVLPDEKGIALIYELKMSMDTYGSRG